MRNLQAGVTVGLLLVQFFYCDLLQRCGDIELNPGPPKRDSSRQSKLQGADQTSDAASSHSQHAPDSKEQSIAEVLTMLHSMNTSLNQKMDDLKSEMSLLREELHGEVEQLRSEVRGLRKENEDLAKKVDDLQGR
ncbi:hypothetical protein ACOMHN_039457 [Nucella lapillus]